MDELANHSSPYSSGVKTPLICSGQITGDNKVLAMMLSGWILC